MEQNQTADRLARLLDEIEGASPPTDPAPAEGLGGILGGLAANPALLSSILPALLSALPSGGGQGASAPVLPEGNTPAPAPKPSPSSDRHTALLCAVKPYLGARRQATAETVLRLCRVWDALNRAGITPSMLSGLLGGTGATATAAYETAPSPAPDEGGA